ncbi:hypothetical protein V6N11_028628 [Hibiscus sabdariffa]|uniref:Reverse transcriptase zinc-binding domain-containing protein n=1 Tax=Hibiscus sabdariffa TaxID=183260 RepID=A0ABR2PQQ7_9ROSI
MYKQISIDFWDITTPAAHLGLGHCPLCHTDDETLLHAFRDCPSSKDVLALAIIHNAIINSQASPTLAWLEEIIMLLDCNSFVGFLILHWNCRNTLEASCKGYIKVNVDGVFDLGLDAATIGIVDRDGNGSILSDFGQRTTDCNEATLAEIAALDNAVKVPYF